jgi:nucleotide-binding universal stress UspA family protein
MTGVVVGVDGSVASTRALAWALESAEQRHVPLTVLRAVEPVPPVYGYYPAWETPQGFVPKLREHAEQDVADQFAKCVADRGREPTVEVHLMADVGRPANVILDHAKDADSIVVGRRGSGGFSRLLIGSVSNAVVHHAHVPVTVVPAPAEARR